MHNLTHQQPDLPADESLHATEAPNWHAGRRCGIRTLAAVLLTSCLLIPVPSGLAAAEEGAAVISTENTADQPSDAAADNASDADAGDAGKAESTDMSYKETVVVTATRMERSIDRLPGSVEVITREEIERREARTVIELLDDLPGVTVSSNGSVGGVASVFIRGAKSEHTLVLVDGVPVNDPISPGRSFDFAHISTENVEQIEVVKGPQSTLFGSDAMGGIINIITRRGSGELEAGGYAEYGSMSTFNAGAGARGGSERVDWSVGFAGSDTDGVSAAAESDGNSEEDGYRQKTGSGFLGLHATDDLVFNLFTRYEDDQGDIDNAGGAFGDDPNSRFDATLLTLRGEMKLDLFDDAWRQTLALFHSRTRRDNDNPPDPDHPDDSVIAEYNGSILGLDWQNDLSVGEHNTVTAGLVWSEESGDSYYYSEGAYGPFEEIFAEQTVSIWGLYVQDQVQIGDRFYAALGLRRDDHELFGGDTNFRIAPAVFLADGRLKVWGAYATAFKAPTLYQLYSAYGSEDLQPEESASVEAGAAWLRGEGAWDASLTWFRTDYKELIDFDPANWVYVNLGEAETRGLELSTTFSPTAGLDFRLHFTHLDTEDVSTGEALLRRPDYAAGLDGHWRIGGRVGLGLTLLRVGKREDFDYVAYDRVTLDAYTLLDAVIDVKITGRIKAFVRGRNLLDEEYQTVLGYGHPGATVLAGVRLGD